MTRDTDRQIIDSQRDINTELVELCHAQLDLCMGLKRAIEAVGVPPETRAMVDGALEDMTHSLRQILSSQKVVFGAQAENVRLTMHGAP